MFWKSVNETLYPHPERYLVRVNRFCTVRGGPQHTHTDTTLHVPFLQQPTARIYSPRADDAA